VEIHFKSLVILIAIIVAPVVLSARSYTGDLPAKFAAQPSGLYMFCQAEHNVGRLALTINNYGTFGSGDTKAAATDCFTGQALPSAEFPRGSESVYLYVGALWVGAPYGRDTLVSVGVDGWQVQSELNPLESPDGDLIRRSTVNPSSPEYYGAVSEQDFVSIYTDAITSGVPELGVDWMSGASHHPLYVQITQKSYAWSDSMSEDFVIFDCSLKNVGQQPLHDVYLGIFVDGDVSGQGETSGGWDDISGFIRSTTQSALPWHCGTILDTLNLAWIADNNGDLNYAIPVPNVTGITVLHSPGGPAAVSYNWWRSNQNKDLDFGPTKNAHYRDLGTGGRGTPEGDRNKYWLMSNHEVDYDQVFAGVTNNADTSWAPIGATIGWTYAPGGDVRYLLSFGPFDAAVGESVPLAFAYVAGKGLHSVASNYENLPYHPDQFMAGLDFSDLIKNAQRAKLTYDTPGVDTDSDGYAGQFQVCCLESLYVGPGPSDYQCTREDTVFITGDGIPDYKPLHVPNCVGITGNVNCDAKNLVDLSDLSALVSYLIDAGYFLRPSCWGEANVNGVGIIDLADLSRLVAYLTSTDGSKPLPRCP
jgi:hypothetical protein